MRAAPTAFAMVPPQSQEDMAQYVVRVACSGQPLVVRPWFPAGPAGINFRSLTARQRDIHA
jgi:hypothetical protein